MSKAKKNHTAPVASSTSAKIPETSSASHAVSSKDLSQSSFHRAQKAHGKVDKSQSSFAIGRGEAERKVQEP